MLRRSFVGLALLCWASALRADDLTAKIAALTDTRDYAHSRWGMLVVDAADGRVVYSRHPDQFFLPASTTKLYTCSAALHYLGPESKFQTPVYRRGALEKGTLKGDLILVASGDLTLGGRTLPDDTMAFANKDHSYADPTSPDAAVTPTDPLAGLRELARQVKAAGIERVTGEVLVDDRLFEKSKGSGSGPELLSPMIVNDNVIDVIVTPGESVGQRARWTIRPETETLQVDFQVRTIAEGSQPHITVTGASPGRLVVQGSIPEKSKPLVRILAVDDPASFARALFIECLRRAGVDVPASPLRDAAGELPEQESYARLERVAVFSSPPLSEAIKVTLKVSQNLYASTLPLLVAAKHGEKKLADGLRREGMYLRLVGVDGNSISFAGGAGGMNADSTTPRATVQLLTALAKRPEGPSIEAGLPLLGMDGTLAGMIPQESPVFGQVHAKTGTLWWDDLANGRSLLRSKALAGTLTTAKGRKLIFAMFVNDVPLPPGILPTREGMLLGKICEVLHLYSD
jgi:D-alanyl-D-alanine carboxypeptidase/D-alanyl-D-alanine-endopeptidase (penicillin-binding protein 4)